MASNNSTIKDPQFAEYSDWIELYNIGESEINTAGWYISDDPDNPAKWQLKSSVVRPGQFRGVWADGLSIDWHTNFFLDKSSGFIGLYSSDTTIIDSVFYPDQRTDISYGRAAGDISNWYYFEDPTPGKVNSHQTYIGFCEPPELLLTSGFYGTTITVEIITPDEQSSIHYTTDGSHPRENSPFYTGPVSIEETSVLKVISVRDGFISSPVASNTYFINENTELPVFSISTDPKNFFDDMTGIYVEGTNGIAGLCSDTPKNWNRDWERPVNIEFYEADKTLILKQDAGIKITGGCSRIYPQKSLAIWARNEYGDNSFSYKFFPDRNIDEYKSLILRSSAQDWWRTMFRDGMIHTLFKNCLDIDYMDYRPAIVFLNGEYYGIHNIREKLNEHFIESNFGVGRDNIDIIEISKDVRVKEGDEFAYNHLIDFISNNDLSSDENYEYVKSLMEIDEYIDYVIAEIYVANGDWPGNNIKAWRRKSPAGKFRWMIFDLDFGFGGNSRGRYSYNSLAAATDPYGPDWPNPPWSTLMLRTLLNNDSFKNEFIQRFAYHINTTFDPDRVLKIIEHLQNDIAAEVPRHKERWEKSISFTDTWDEGVEIMREFARERPEYVRKHFSDKFNLGGSASLTLKTNDTNGGYITAFNKILTDSIFVGKFFKKAPILLEARPKPGYRFSGWSGVLDAGGGKAELILNYDYTVKANFEPDSSHTNAPVFNEINYNSSPDFDVEDWVEIYNPTREILDISGWTFKDSVDSHVFQFRENTLLQPDSYIVLCRDTSAFKSFFPDVLNFTGNFDFGLSNGGEFIRLYDKFGLLVDSIRYDDEAPWPLESDGTGATLSLLSADLDNALSQSWIASENYGTPGVRNDLVNSVESINNEFPASFKLYQNYPNPFNPSTTIQYSIPAVEKVTSKFGVRNSEFEIRNSDYINQHQESGFQNQASSNQPAYRTGRHQISITLKVYDILGREVATLVNEEQNPGHYKVEFSAENLASGIYYYSMQAGSYSVAKKMILLK